MPLARLTKISVFLLFGLIVAQVATAQTETVLYNFMGSGNYGDGARPYGGVIRDAKGNLYGTTEVGGSSSNCYPDGCGTVFEMTATGYEKILHSFNANGTDGYYPFSGLVMDKNGNLYGTTSQGGTYGDGTVFEISATGTETILHSFDGNEGDGSGLYYAGLVMDSKGNLYGTTPDGGMYGGGTVFEIGANGTYTILHNFAYKAGDGFWPLAGLVMDKSGNLYGTTNAGGAYDQGTAFELSATGTETILHSFTSYWTDGLIPVSVLIMDKIGNLFGTTNAGGANNSGTAFVLVGYGADGILYNFGNNATDGIFPYAGLVMDKRGNLYGETSQGGTYGDGTVFEISTNGTYTILHSFAGGTTDGIAPYGGLAIDGKGNLYGTTVAGGQWGYGILFKLVP